MEELHANAPRSVDTVLVPEFAQKKHSSATRQVPFMVGIPKPFAITLCNHAEDHHRQCCWNSEASAETKNYIHQQMPWWHLPSIREVSRASSFGLDFCICLVGVVGCLWCASSTNKRSHCNLHAVYLWGSSAYHILWIFTFYIPMNQVHYALWFCNPGDKL